MCFGVDVVPIPLWSRRSVLINGLLLAGCLASPFLASPVFAEDRPAARVLLISATDDVSKEASLGVALDALQEDRDVAYDRYVAVKDGVLLTDQLPLTNPDGTPKYTGILLTTGSAAYRDADGRWLSALTPEQWAQLERYELANDVRRVALYSVPTADLGLEPFGTPHEGPSLLTAAPEAASALPGIEGLGDLPIDGVWHYPAKVARPEMVKQVLNFQEGDQKSVAAAIVTFPGGREQLHFFFGQWRGVAASVPLAPLWREWLKPKTDPIPFPQPDTFLGSFAARFAGYDHDTRYKGTVTIAEDGELYGVKVTLGSHSYSGPGVKIGDRLFAAWSLVPNDAGLVTYQVTPEGNLKGSFVRGDDVQDHGEETISGANLHALGGDYSYQGVSKKNGAYSGTIRIIKLANTYQVEWYSNGWLVRGIGHLVDDVLVVGYGSSLSYGAVEYTRGADGGFSGLEGNWIHNGVDLVFKQILSRSEPL